MDERTAIAQLPVVTTQAESLAITDEDSKLGGGELLVALKDCKSAIQAARDERANPYVTKLQEIRDAARPFLEKLEEAIKTVQGKLSRYNAARLLAAQEQQAQANKEHRAALAEVHAEADKTGELPEPVAPPPVVPTPIKTITTTDGGTLTATKVKKWTIPDYVVGEELEKISRADPRLKTLPDHWFLFDVGRMTRHVKSVGLPGQPVPDAPGILVYEEETFTRRKGKAQT